MMSEMELLNKALGERMKANLQKVLASLNQRVQFVMGGSYASGLRSEDTGERSQHEGSEDDDSEEDFSNHEDSNDEDSEGDDSNDEDMGHEAGEDNDSDAERSEYDKATSQADHERLAAALVLSFLRNEVMTGIRAQTNEELRRRHHKRRTRDKRRYNGAHPDELASEEEFLRYRTRAACRAVCALFTATNGRTNSGVVLWQLRSGGLPQRFSWACAT